MSIKDLLQKINPFYNLLLILFLALIFFALGRISALEELHSPIKIQYPKARVEKSQTSSVIQSGVSFPDADTTPNSDGSVIGSKSGKKYYFPWCGTVKRIKPENQVKFASAEDARKAGFLPGGNCKGLN